MSTGSLPGAPGFSKFMPGTCGCGRSASLLAKVTGSFPHGFASPKRRFASASAPRMPGNQISMTPLTCSLHGMATGPPVSSTTIVRGFAAATAATSLSWSIVRGLGPGVLSAGQANRWRVLSLAHRLVHEHDGNFSGLRERGGLHECPRRCRIRPSHPVPLP